MTLHGKPHASCYGAMTNNPTNNLINNSESASQFSKDHALESFRYGPRLLGGILRQLPKRMWNYKPNAETWSIHEIVIHLADVEAAEYLNCRVIIAGSGKLSSNLEPELEWASPNMSNWSLSLGYFYQSPRQALETIRILRAMTHNLLLGLPASAWMSSLSAPSGETSLRDWLVAQERYIPSQIERMNALYSAWVKAHRRNATARKPRRTFTPATADAETQMRERQTYTGNSKQAVRTL
jgi:hypothetical protein